MAGATAGWKAKDASGNVREFRLRFGKWDGAAAPTANDDADDGFQPGSIWIDTTNDHVYGCVDATVGAAVWLQLDVGVTDHGALTGLGDDDHAQYALLAGRSGGQLLKGGTAASDALTLQSTNNATRGGVMLADDDWLRFDEMTAPGTPAAGKVALYAKADGRFYGKDDAGTEFTLAGLNISGLTEVDVAIDDELAIADTSDSGANKKLGVERLGGFFHPAICDGRLTLTSGTPVTTADVAAASTIYWTPFVGDRVALYDGTRWRLYTFSEISMALSSLSALPYDVFVYDNAGTLTLEKVAWTNDTTRATALALQDGIYVKSGATTRRYLGTFRASDPTTTEDKETWRALWNYYHRAPRKLKRTDTTNTWTYGTAAWRAWNNNTANSVAVVVGVAEVMADLLFFDVMQGGVNGGNPAIGIGYDSSTANSAEVNSWAAGDSARSFLSQATLRHYPAIGAHTYYAIEYHDPSSADSGTFYGDGNRTYAQLGLVGCIWG